jgi:ketosteroid isomerase-like protein
VLRACQTAARSPRRAPTLARDPAQEGRRRQPTLVPHLTAPSSLVIAERAWDRLYRVGIEARSRLFGRLSYRPIAMDRADAIDLLQRLHAAQGAFYAGGDEAPVRALLTDDVHWHVPGRNAIAGAYHGIDAVLAYFRRRRDLVDRSLRLHPGEVLIGDGDHIAALTDGTAVVGGVERRWSTLGLYQVRAGQVAACWLLPLDPNAFDDVWGSST